MIKEDVEDIFIDWSDDGIMVKITQEYNYYRIAIFDVDIEKVRKALRLAKRRYKFTYESSLCNNRETVTFGIPLRTEPFSPHYIGVAIYPK